MRLALNYDAATDLLVNAFKNNKKVTYDELEKALDLDYSIEDQEHTAHTKGIIEKLRTGLKIKHGLTFKNAATGNHATPDYYYYTVSKVIKKEGKFTLKKEEKLKEVKYPSYELERQVNALKKDNEDLYNKILKLEEQNKKLLDMVATAGSKEEEYKNIIHSLMNITNII